MYNRLLGLFLVVVGIALIVATFLPPETTLSFARSSRELASMHEVGIAVMLGVLYSVTFAFTIPVTTVLALMLGFLYGFWVALLITMTATLLGALTIFLLARAGRFAQCKPLIGEAYTALFTWAKQEPVSYLLASRFAPLVPFPVVHLLPAEAEVRTLYFMLATFLGTLPASAAFVALGASSHHYAMGGTLPILPITIALIALSVLVFSGIFGIKRDRIRNALQGMQKTRPSQKAVLHETTDA